MRCGELQSRSEFSSPFYAIDGKHADGLPYGKRTALLASPLHFLRNFCTKFYAFSSTGLGCGPLTSGLIFQSVGR